MMSTANRRQLLIRAWEEAVEGAIEDGIVAFEPYEDGFGIMRDAQTAKPQTFVTGDGWFVYNLATNLAQM